jgi:hypothetical protein
MDTVHARWMPNRTIHRIPHPPRVREGKYLNKPKIFLSLRKTSYLCAILDNNAWGNSYTYYVWLPVFYPAQKDIRLKAHQTYKTLTGKRFH